ncbi:MAG: ribonuclease Z [Acidobacteria bacterium]|nr:ribonuclease Z [Acidobacteriota bacterium]
MRLIVLGSGSSVPHPARSSSAYWVETRSGSILLDCAASAIHRMAQEQLDWANLDAIWISHFHLDHIGGLFPLLFGLKYAPETQDRTKPLKIFGPRGLCALIDRVQSANNYRLLAQPFPVEVIEVDPLDEFDFLPNVSGVGFSTPHTPESLAILIRENDTTLVFTSDTGFTKALANFAREVDLFVLECSFIKEKPVETHIELEEAKYLIRKARPKRAMLTHFYPEWDDADFRTLAGEEILEARDGLILEF